MTQSYFKKTYDDIRRNAIEVAEIWGRENCTYCEKAKEICIERKIPFEYIDVNTPALLDSFKENFPDHKTVPQIKYKGKHIGGYTELVKKLNNEP